MKSVLRIMNRDILSFKWESFMCENVKCHISLENKDGQK